MRGVTCKAPEVAVDTMVLGWRVEDMAAVVEVEVAMVEVSTVVAAVLGEVVRAMAAATAAVMVVESETAALSVVLLVATILRT